MFLLLARKREKMRIRKLIKNRSRRAEKRKKINFGSKIDKTKPTGLCETDEENVENVRSGRITNNEIEGKLLVF